MRYMLLHEFVSANRGEIIARCRSKISTRPAPRATDVELEHGVPIFLDQLIETLSSALALAVPPSTTGTKHGNELLKRGFTVAQVVQDYGGIGQTITELAGERAASITVDEYQTLHRCLDQGIADAVTEYARLRAHEGTERLGRLAHDLRNQLNSALLSYEMLKMGAVPIASSTGMVLGRSLSGLRNLIDRELAEVRLSAGVYQRETVGVFDVIEDVEVAATMDANVRDLEFSVIWPARDVMVHADRQILEAVIANLLQNAFKFTQPKSHVTLRTQATSDRVLIDIEDRCGGLPPGIAESMGGSVEQQSIARSGPGMGLRICARGAEINDGSVRVRNQPGNGCVFTVDLPRAQG